MMLSVTVHSVKGDTTYRALNDAVVSGAQSRIYDFGFSVDGSKLYKFRADGLILATPAGSTAYSLSAGGPVVDPESECVIFTPICPHALFNRSTLFCADKTITVSTDSDYSGEVYLTIDGGAPIRIHKTDTVSVSRSTYYTELIQTADRNDKVAAFRQCGVIFAERDVFILPAVLFVHECFRTVFLQNRQNFPGVCVRIAFIQIWNHRNFHKPQSFLSSAA